MRVYVKNLRNQPLMPTTQRKARKLLKQSLAKIVSHKPFTIQLLYVAGETKQQITLGVDTGSKTIGISATTKKEELYSSEIHLRTDVVNLISTKRQLRHTRRNRKTRYRQPRFNNRVSTKKEGWLAPSIKGKINAHLRIISDIYKILPISKIIVETASFDIQKIKNPNINNLEYQKGEQFNFWNVREYVLFRDGHKCRGEKDCKNTVLNVHHIESQKTGGDAPNNLITLCEVCHHSYHKGELKLSLKRGQKFNDTTFMGIMKWSFYNKLKELYPNVKNTYGYITKSIRIDNKITKTHVTDAYCITKNIQAKRLSSYFMVNQVRKKKRSLHEETARKGRNKPNVLSKRNSKNTKQISHKNKLWCLNDKVELNEQIGFISGFSGNTVYIQDIKGQYLQSSPKYKQNNTDIIRLIERNNNWVYQEVSIQQLISSHD